MTTAHHPTESWLIRYAGGRLPDSFRRVIHSHVSVCQVCRDAVDDATEMSALMCVAMQGNRLSFDIKQFANDLDDEDVDGRSGAPRDAAPEADFGSVIDQLLAVGGEQTLRWRAAGRGVSYVRLRTDDAMGRLWLLRAEPGTVLPEHGHRGDELTLVLKGAYFNRDRFFKAGDIEEADDTVEHKPVVAFDEPCICLAATDAPLRFRGWVPRLAQSVIRL